MGRPGARMGWRTGGGGAILGAMPKPKPSRGANRQKDVARVVREKKFTRDPRPFRPEGRLPWGGGKAGK